jgi:hypothetical protein
LAGVKALLDGGWLNAAMPAGAVFLLGVVSLLALYRGVKL